MLTIVIANTFSMLYHWLIAPSDKILQADRRRQASLLATLVILLVLTVGVYETATILEVDGSEVYIGYRYSLVIIAFLGLAYALSRTRYYLLGGLLTLLVLTAGIFFFALFTDTDFASGYLYYLILPILLASHFFPHAASGFYGVGVVLAVGSLPWLFPERVTLAAIADELPFTITTYIMVMLLAHRRDLLERDRKALLEREEERLIGLVDVRTADLEEANELLQQEVAERQLAEQSLSKAYDVLEQRVLERTAELAQANQENSLLLSALGSILIGVNPGGTVTHWSETAGEFLGLVSDQALGRNFFDLPLGWDWAALRQAIENCRQLRRKVRLDDVRFSLADGRLRLLGLSFTPLPDMQSGQVGFLLVGSDITERKSLEQQLSQARKLESIGRLAAGIAHEINTPAQYVSGNLRFVHQGYLRLLDYVLNIEEFKTQVERGVPLAEIPHLLDPLSKGTEMKYLLEEFPIAIEQSLDGMERISNIVRAMRDFSHPGATTMSLADINHSLESTIAVARNEWKYVAEVETRLDPQLPHIRCLPAELNQVFLNLIVNAVHAIEEAFANREGELGQIVIATRLDGEWVEISVADNGAGIPEEIREHVYDPFFTTKDVGKGTGQGLAIAYNVVVNKHNGALWFESRAGKGTTFFIRLPIHQAPEIYAENDISSDSLSSQIVPAR